MGKLRKAAVAAVIIGSVSFIATGATTAQGAVSMRGGGCTNVDVLGEVGVGNGILGNLLNGEGDPGAQSTSFC